MTRVILHAVRRLKPIRHTFDAVAFIGMSGALIAPSIAQRLKKDVLAVRKHQECHSENQVEGRGSSRYIIVDDFIASGWTLSRIQEKIYDWDEQSKLVGILLYGTSFVSYWTNEFFSVSANKEVWLLHNGCQQPQYFPFDPEKKDQLP